MEKTRGFEVVSSFAEKGINIPQRKTADSAGYDIEAAEDVPVFKGGTSVVATGLKAYMQPDEVLQIYIRSSLAINKGLSLKNSTGIIDSDYYNNPDNEGHILLAVKNDSELETFHIKKGMRIAQGIFQNFLPADGDVANDKRQGGIGSTNKKEVV